MPHLGVLFEIRGAETRPGEAVGVVGGLPELGSWDPFDYKAAAGLRLRTGARQYPCWAMPAPVWIELTSGVNGGLEKDSESVSDSDLDSEASIPPSPETQTRDLLVSQEDEDDPDCPFGGIRAHTEGGLADAFIRIEYKYVKDRQQLSDCGPSIQWEDCIANRRVMIPQEHGSIWIVSDAKFNDTAEPTVTRTSLAEVLARRGDLDPEWTFYQRDPDAPEWSGTHAEDLSSPGSVTTNCSQHTTSTVFFM